MYKIFFLTAQVILFSSLTQAAFFEARLGGERGAKDSIVASAKSFALVDDQQLREYVKQNISQIENVVASNKSSAEKLSFIQDRVKRVADFRAKHWSKSAYVEYELDMTIKPYESFPSAQNFKPSRCQEFESTLINDWEPLAPNMKPSNRGVSNALANLKKICS